LVFCREFIKVAHFCKLRLTHHGFSQTAAASLNASAQVSTRDVSIESFTSKRRTDADIEKSKSENTREFYSRQNSIIGLFEEVEKHGAPENAASITQGLDDDGTRP
jgi:hypothetical protein